MLQVLGTVDGRWWLGGCRLSESHGQGGQRRFSGKIQVGPKGRKVGQAKIWGKHLGRRHVGPWQVLEKEVGIDGSQETRADGDHGWKWEMQEMPRDQPHMVQTGVLIRVVVAEVCG